MRTEQDSNRNDITGIIGVGVFFFLTILVPFLKIGGGFLWGDIGVNEFPLSIDLFWDKMTGIFMTIPFESNYNVVPNEIYTSLGGAENIIFIWLLIPSWRLMWLGLGFIGTVLVLIPPLM